MRLAIRWTDNDFGNQIRTFFQLFLIPTFIKKDKGYKVTHLTHSMVVELFNLHMPYINRWWNWKFNDKWYPQYIGLEAFPLEDYFVITELDVYFDNEIEKGIKEWGDYDFYKTDGNSMI